MKKSISASSESQSKTGLLCQSIPAKMTSTYAKYAAVAAVVIAFEAIVFWQKIFHPLQIALVAACLLSVCYYTVKTMRDAKDWLRLYDDHVETKDGTFPYDTIRDYYAVKNQLTIERKKKKIYYVENANELVHVIRRQRDKAS